MKRTISFVMALVMCCSLLLSALPAAKAVSMNFIPDDPNKIPPEKKISLSLLEQMAGKADDEEVFLNLFIRGLSESELAALIPLPKPGEYASSEEITAYARAEHDLKQRLYPGMVDAFVQRYLDDTARVGYKFYEALPGFQGYVRKSDIPRLIALDEVVWLNYAQSIYLVKEHALSDKIAAPLLEYMQTAAEDEKIPVRLMLRGAISQEIEALAPVSYPTMDATAEDIQAYRAARTAAATAFQLDRYGVFARNHLDENDEILYSPGDVKIPVMVVKTTCAKIAELASLRLVSQIDPAFGYDEAFPDPELPANPAELEKLNVRLREFMAVATHDELIPVSITLKTPTSINSISNREEKLAAFKLLTAEFVNDRLDETDEVLVRSTNSVWAIVPKYKIAQLAALEDVTSISWIPEHSDPLYPASGEAVYVRDDSQETALSNKIAWPLQVKMTGTADDTPLRVQIHLDAPSLRDIDAQMIGKQFSTVDELYAYRDALHRQYLEECASIYDPFVQNYLNEAEEQVSVQGDYAYVLATLSKTRIAALANLNEVTRIEQWHEQDPTEPVLPSEAPGVQAVPEKLRTGLRWEMNGAAEDESIGILLWLNAPTHREIDATVPAPEDPTDPEQCEAFISAAYRARTATEHGIVEAFVQNHMKGTNELQFAGQDGPYLLAATTKARILALTALDEVAWIDQENWPVFPTDDVPQVPTAAPSGSYNALKQAIAEAEKLDLNDYTSSTANEVYSALQYAREALESEYQEVMDAATKALNDAVAALVAWTVLDFTEVNELAARVDAVNRDRSRYTAESLKEFDRLCAMTSIDDLVMEEEQEAVDYAAKCLRDALAALVELAPPLEADKSELVKAIQTYTIPALNYTYETCKPYNDAFNNAIAVNEKEDATQDEVDSAVSALKAAYAALKTPDFAALDAAIEAAEKIDRTKYTVESLTAMDQALNAARSFDRDTPKQADIDATAQALNAAITALFASESATPAYSEKCSPDLVEYMEGKPDDEGIPVAFWLKAPSDAELEAMVPLTPPADDATMEEVSAYLMTKRRAVTAIMTEITDAFVRDHLDEKDEIIFQSKMVATVWAVVPKAKVLSLASAAEVVLINYFGDPRQTAVPAYGANKRELVEAIIDLLPPINYTEETNLAFQAALANAILVNEQADATQDEVDAALAELKAARAALKYPDYELLRVAIASAEAIDRSKYESLDAVDQALAAAKEALTTLSQTQIDAAAEALIDAVERLEIIERFRFDDVMDDKQFYYEPVYWAVDQKITTGTSEKLFSPNDACTRAQVVTMLWRASGSRKPERNENPFHDVTKDDYYYDAVLWAVEEGITNGVAEDAFGPDQTCTRAQIVTFIWRWFGKNDPRGNDGVLPEAFADVDGDAYYADAVLWAVKLNITSGTTATTFRPDQICTRGQIVTFLWRAWFARRVDLPE